MRAPPPVEYASGCGRAWRGALSLLVGAAVAVPLAWGWPYAALSASFPDGGRSGAFSVWRVDPAVQEAFAAGIGAVVGAAFWRSRRVGRASERTLRWDGQDWVLFGHRAGEGEGQPGQPQRRGQVALMLDLGPWMLVRFSPDATGVEGGGADAWLPLAEADDRAHWAALRGALWNWRGGTARRA
jgi:hypothetical protein